MDLPLGRDDVVDDYRDATQRGDEKILRTARGLVVRRAEAPWLDVGMVAVVVVVAVAVAVVVASIGVVGEGAGAGEEGW